MGSTSSAIFSGSSRFSTDLQQVINRAVQIASLPVQQLNTKQSKLQDESTALSALDQKVATVQKTVASIQTSLTSGLLNSSISDGGVIRANVQPSATQGSYSIEVLDTGSYSSALSDPPATKVTDPTSQGLSTSLHYTLTVDGVTTSISPATNSLSDLAEAINSGSGGAVQATIVNVGGSGASDFRLSLRAGRLGPVNIQLNDGSLDLLSSLVPGSLASYKVAGLSTVLTSDSRTVTLAPGLTVDLLSKSTPGQASTITVQRDPSALASAIASFAQAYNAVVDETAKYHGKDAGALQGDPTLTAVSSVLRQLSGYNTGSVGTGLPQYGITVDKDGHLLVDQAAFNLTASTHFSDLSSLLGNTATSGFLQTATVLLNSLEDSTTGALKIQENSLQDQITRQQAAIDAQQARVDQIQTDLQQRMSAADSLIASLEQQVTYITGLFTAQKDILKNQ